MEDLEEYRNKRDFKITPEPISESTATDNINKDTDTGTKKNIFVVHEHHASHLHWDLRLEIGGVLRSWAVPKEPPLVEGIKRLAIQVEDHPLEYATFEGIIPEGNYGAGTVSIFDKGEFILEEETDKKLEFELKGNKLNGKYVLVKFKGDKQWLFFKKKVK